MRTPLTTFVVSLKTSTDRRRRVEEHFKKIGLSFEWLDAVYGKGLMPEYIKEHCDTEAIKNHPTWLTPGAIGCALSHYHIYLEVIRRQLPYALVLEDDVIVEKDFLKYINTLLPLLKKNEVVSLFYQSWEPIKLSAATATDIHKPYKLYTPLDIYQPISTAGYFITLDACKTMAAGMLPIRRTSDSWGKFKDAGEFENFRVVYPRPVDVVDAKSTIEYMSDGWKVNLLKWIDKNKIFPIYQMLKQRRKASRMKMMKVEMVN